MEVRAIYDTLEVNVRCVRPDSDYAPDLTLEIQVAEILLTALSKSAAALNCPWSTVDLRLHLQYGSGARWHTTTSSFYLAVKRADLEGLRDGKLSSWQLVRRARLGLAVKSVPQGSGMWKEWKTIPAP